MGSADSVSGAPAEDSNTLAKVRATAGTLTARAKDSAGVFMAAAERTASATAEGLRRLALGEPLQALCRAETSRTPVPQLVLMCCTALTAGQNTRQQLACLGHPCMKQTLATHVSLRHWTTNHVG